MGLINIPSTTGVYNMSMGGSLITELKPKETTIRAVITRADGTVEDLGVIAYYHKNPLMRFFWKLGQHFKAKRN
jgi:hypothetical protein